MYKIHCHSPEVETYEITLLIHFIQEILSTTRLSIDDFRWMATSPSKNESKGKKCMHFLKSMHLDIRLLCNILLD